MSLPSTIAALRQAYTSGSLSPVDAIQSLSDTIESRDSEIGGYLSKDTETALKRKIPIFHCLSVAYRSRSKT